MSIAPPALITGAARLPLPFGLFSTLSLRTGGADRWPLGVQWEPGTCDPVLGIGDVECGDPEIVRVTISGGPSTGTWTLDWANKGPTTNLAIDATAKQVEDALNEFVTGGVSVASEQAGGPYFITFNLIGDQPPLDGSNTFDTGLLTMVVTHQGNLDPGSNIGVPKYLDPNNERIPLATPFTVYGWFACSPVGYTFASAQDLATAHLLGREEQRVEQAFWTCDLGNIPGLACSGATDVSVGIGDPLGLSIGLLETYLATNYGNLGVIHMTRATALAAIAEELVVSAVGRLFTKLGTPVAAGGGYPGTGPLGQSPPAGGSYMYATPAMFGYRSDVFTSSSRPGDLFATSTNDLTAIAERTYLLGYDPCGVAVALTQYATIPAGPPQ